MGSSRRGRLGRTDGNGSREANKKCDQRERERERKAQAKRKKDRPFRLVPSPSARGATGEVVP